MQTYQAAFSAFHAVAFAELLFIGGAVHLRSTRHKGSEKYFSFDYAQHGQDWIAGACTSDVRQSPIDLPAQAPIAGSFSYKYNPINEPFDVMNNGHSLSADFAGLGYGGIQYNDEWYNFLNINVHAESEHAWNGVKKPIELHMVHKHYKAELFLIVAVAVESATPPTKLLQLSKGNQSGGPAPTYIIKGYQQPSSGDADFNPVVQTFVAVKPPAVNMRVSVPIEPEKPVDLNSMFEGGAFYEYAGSLTAPPCSEEAMWLVRKDPIKASDAQVLLLHDAIYKTTADFGNWRSLQPINDRSVRMLQASSEKPPRTPPQHIPLEGFGDPQKSDREFRALKWSMDAMTVAKGATDYIKDLDQRVRNAAEAHAEVLSTELDPVDLPKAEADMPTAPVVLNSPIRMEAAAKEIAGKLAEAAREEVQDAEKQLSVKAREAALQAAFEAANMVDNGQGNINHLADNVKLPGMPGMPMEAEKENEANNWKWKAIPPGAAGQQQER